MKSEVIDNQADTCWSSSWKIRALLWLLLIRTCVSPRRLHLNRREPSTMDLWSLAGHFWYLSDSIASPFPWQLHPKDLTALSCLLGLNCSVESEIVECEELSCNFSWELAFGFCSDFWRSQRITKLSGVLLAGQPELWIKAIMNYRRLCNCLCLSLENNVKLRSWSDLYL